MKTLSHRSFRAPPAPPPSVAVSGRVYTTLAELGEQTHLLERELAAAKAEIAAFKAPKPAPPPETNASRLGTVIEVLSRAEGSGSRDYMSRAVGESDADVRAWILRSAAARFGICLERVIVGEPNREQLDQARIDGAQKALDALKGRFFFDGDLRRAVLGDRA